MKAFVFALLAGGQLGNGKAVSYPIIGIKTFKPAAWGDLEISGGVKLFKTDENSQDEASVYFENAEASKITNDGDLQALVRDRFTVKDVVVQKNPESLVVFALANDQKSEQRGCAWNQAQAKQLCFVSITKQKSDAISINTILQKLTFLE